jgi:cell division septation protein DedD
MTRLAIPILALALGAAVAVGLVSCGSRDEKGLLPGNNAQQILDNLDQVKADVQDGDCSSASAEVATIQDEIDALPTTVDPQLRARLSDGAQRLADVVNSPGACETTTAATTTVEPTSTESTTTQKNEKTKSTTTSTTTSTTAPTTPATTPTTPTTPGTSTGGTPGEGGGVVPPGQSGNQGGG